MIFDGLELENLKKKTEELINDDFNSRGNATVVIAERTGYNKNFISYVIQSNSLHYNDIDVLEHIVRFVAKKSEEQFGISCNEEIPGGNLTKDIGLICKTLKEDDAFALNDDAALESELTIRREFPLLTRFAIVATYCASYNPPSTDQRYFFTGRDILRRKKRTERSVKSHAHEFGPRPFEHQRGQFIFLYFCKTYDELFDKDLDTPLDFTSQLTHLLNLGLLKMTSAQGNFELPMFVSLCSLEFADLIARTISSDLKIKDRLFDFASEF